MSAPLLPSMEQTEERRAQVLHAFHHEGNEPGMVHPHALPVFEHDHWWVICGPCGATWDAVDTETEGGEETFDFERINDGDGSCEYRS